MAFIKLTPSRSFYGGFSPVRRDDPIERLPAPTGLDVNLVDDDIDPVWDAVVDADHYEYSVLGEVEVLGDVLTVSIDDLPNGSYTFFVRAVDALGVKGYWAYEDFIVDTTPANARLNEDGTPRLTEDDEFRVTEN